MPKCPHCGKHRELTEPCVHCGDGPRAAVKASAEALSFDQLDALDAPARKAAPLPEESLARFAHIVDESPLFAGAEEPVLPVVAPIEAAPRPLDVEIEPRFETAGAPADAEPLTHLLLTLTPDGPPLLDPAAGPVAHVVLALDLSASMNHPDKYPVLTEALAGMLYGLRSQAAADVLLSVVVYAYGSETLLENASAKSVDPRELLAAIDRSQLRFGRYTDIVGALKRAGAIALASLRANRAMPVRVYVLTDGRPQDMEGARHVMEKVSAMPVDVDALAFGSDADVKALQDLVAGGRGGTAKHVRADNLGEAFGRIAEVAQKVVAPRALFDFELAPGVVGGAAFRFRPARHRYGDAAFRGGTRFSVDLGTLESGRPYSLLFELRLPPGVAGRETEVGRATLRVPGFGGPRVFERLLAIPRHAGSAAAADPEVTAARDVLVALTGDDPDTMLRALQARRRIYYEERRDPHLISVIDKAIAEIVERGNLARLTAAEHAALLSHTCTAGGAGSAARPRTRAAAR